MVPGEPFVAAVVLKSCSGLCIRTVDDLIFLCKEPSPELSGRLFWLLNYVAQVIGIWWSHISALKVVEECGFQIFPPANGLCWQAVEPMSSRSFEFEWEVFDGE